eukprot:SAG11_NODE_1342_length_5154_cov_2.272404_7_plen_182_part_00
MENLPSGSVAQTADGGRLMVGVVTDRARCPCMCEPITVDPARPFLSRSASFVESPISSVGLWARVLQPSVPEHPAFRLVACSHGYSKPAHTHNTHRHTPSERERESGPAVPFLFSCAAPQTTQFPKRRSPLPAPAPTQDRLPLRAPAQDRPGSACEPSPAAAAGWLERLECRAPSRNPMLS